MYAQMQYEAVEQGRDGTGNLVPKESGFAIRRIRLYLMGDLTEKAGYMIQLDGGQGRDARIIDAKLSFKHFGPALILNAGQWNSTNLGGGAPKWWQFIEPDKRGDTIVDAGRVRGVGVEGRFFDKKLHYDAMLVNGSGIGTGSGGADENTDKRYRLLARYEPFGPVSPFQNDVAHGPFQFQLSVDGSISRDADTAIGSQDKAWLSGSLVAKGEGLFGKFVYGFVDVENDLGAVKDQEYWSLQAGYAIPVWSKHFLEPVARYEVLDENKWAADRKVKWARLGMNYYFNGPRSVLKINYTLKGEQGPHHINNDAFQVMYQFMF